MKTKRVYAKALKPGDKIKLVVEGTWRPWDDDAIPGHGRVMNSLGQTVAATTDLSTVDKFVSTPDWKPGDVALVRFYTGQAEEYTYVRDKTGWPGKSRPLSDDQLDDLFVRGLVRYVPAASLQAMAAGTKVFPSTLRFGSGSVDVPLPVWNTWETRS